MLCNCRHHHPFQKPAHPCRFLRRTDGLLYKSGIWQKHDRWAGRLGSLRLYQEDAAISLAPYIAGQSHSANLAAILKMQDMHLESSPSNVS